MSTFLRGSLFVLCGVLGVPLFSSAATLIYNDGVCVEFRDEFASGDCIMWEGPDGFSVTTDMTDWILFGDSFRSPGFDVITGTPETDSTHLVFRRDDPFDLSSLDLHLGGSQPEECAPRIEVRSSKGGWLPIEPAAASNARCWQYLVEGGLEIAPYPWSTSSLTVGFAAPEWRNIDWFYVGFAPEMRYVEPRPKIMSFSVEAVHYVPEPAIALLFLAAGVVTAAHRRRLTTLRERESATPLA